MSIACMRRKAKAGKAQHALPGEDRTRMRVSPVLMAALVALAIAPVAFTQGHASQTSRRPGPCVVNDAAMTQDDEVVRLGTDYQPRRGAGAKLQIGGNITDIVWIYNHSDCPITLDKHQWGVFGTSGDVIEVPPRGSFSGHMWVPWRDGPGGQSISLSIRGRPHFYLWQMSGRVAFYSEGGYRRAIDAGWESYKAGYGRSLSVPGLWLEGGPRALHVVITPDGKPFFKIEGIPEE